MSEYAAVAVFDNQRDGHYIRVTWGGQPNEIGWKLHEAYEDVDSARALISLGDCMSVGHRIGRPFVPGKDDIGYEPGEDAGGYEWSKRNDCCRAYMRDLRRLDEVYMPKVLNNGIVEFYNLFAEVDGHSASWAEHLYAWLDGFWYCRPANDPTGGWVELRHAIRMYDEYWGDPSIDIDLDWGTVLERHEKQFHRVARLGMPAP